MSNLIKGKNMKTAMDKIMFGFYIGVGIYSFNCLLNIIYKIGYKLYILLNRIPV
jgi:hypothetical protein